ncbi:hypothetical protein GQ43DRAFT_345352, partial [Delitschia confertaspora ATCC 74209]
LTIESANTHTSACIRAACSEYCMPFSTIRDRLSRTVPCDELEANGKILTKLEQAAIVKCI